jgi:hypothetical protein
MKEDKIHSKIEELKEKAEEEDITLLEVEGEEWGWNIKENDPIKFIETGKELGAEVFYYIISEKDGQIQKLSILYPTRNQPHVMELTADWYQEIQQEEHQKEEETEEAKGLGRYSEEVNEKLEERRQEILEELQEKEDLDPISEEEKIRVKHGEPEDFSLRELERIQDQIFESEEANEVLEDELARKVYEDENFNNNFNNLDTETLLKSREDISKEDFKREDVRVGMVHKKAKSLLKVEGY